MGLANPTLFAAPYFCLLAKLRIVSFPHFRYTTSVNGHMAVVMALWNGDIVQKNNKDHDIDCWLPFIFFLLPLTTFQTSPIARGTPRLSWTHLGLAFRSTFVTLMRSFSLIPSTGTRITSGSRCGCYSLLFTVSLVRDADPSFSYCI
jgi:hypothetical protein